MTAENNLELLKALSEESRYNMIEVFLNSEICVYMPEQIGRTQSNTPNLTKLANFGILK